MTNEKLIAMGMIGVLVHNLTELDKRKKSGKRFNIIAYYQLQWASVVLSIILVIGAVIAKDEIKSLKAGSLVMGDYFAIFMAVWGYSGQSIFLKFVRFVKKLYTGDMTHENKEPKNNEDDKG